MHASSHHQILDWINLDQVCHFEVLAPHDSGVQPPLLGVMVGGPVGMLGCWAMVKTEVSMSADSTDYLSNSSLQVDPVGDLVKR